MPVEPTRLIEKLVWEWLYTTLGYDEDMVIRSDQNGPPRQGDYITFVFIGETPAENAHFAKELIRTNEDPDPPEYDPNLLLNIYTKRVMATMGVQIWSKNAREQHRLLSMSRELRATRQIFAPFRTAFVGVEASSNNVHIGDVANVNRVGCSYRFATNAQMTEQNERVWEIIVDGQIER